MMLEHVERDASGVVLGNDLTVEKCVWRQILTCFSGGGKLIRNRFARLDQSVRPVESLPLIAIAFELDRLEPVLTLRQLLDGSRIHRFDEV